MPEPVVFPLRVELPRSQHAMLRDPEEVPERLRRPLLDAMEQVSVAVTAAGVTQAEIAAARDGDEELAAAIGIKAMAHGARGRQRAANDLLIVALVESWSFATPVSVESLLDLPGRTYDALVEACDPYLAAMSPDFDPSPDPDSPTRPSSG